MANGWTPEQRARQAESIRRWQPWLKSTGPRTPDGRAKRSMNAKTHGRRSRGAGDATRMRRTMVRICKGRR